MGLIFIIRVRVIYQNVILNYNKQDIEFSFISLLISINLEWVVILLYQILLLYLILIKSQTNIHIKYLRYKSVSNKIIFPKIEFEFSNNCCIIFFLNTNNYHQKSLINY